LVLRKARPVVARKEGNDTSAPANEQLLTDLLDELSSCYESLSAIFRYGAEQSKITDLKKFGRRLLGDLMNIVGADWFVFRVAQGDGRLAVLVASETALELEPLSLRSPHDAIEAEAWLARKDVWFDEQRPIKASDPLAVKRDSQGLAQPVFVGENLIGILVLGKTGGAQSSNKSNLIFTARQANVIATFAHFLAIQIVNARFQEEQFNNRMVARELEIAGTIQQSLLLKKLPELPEFELAAFCQSAHSVGGDFYDVLKVTDDAALLVIADVMGKGVLAAMFAAILRTVLRASPELTNQPAALLTRVNRLLFEELSGVDMFITAQLAYIDTKSRRLVTASAGHCPLLIAPGDGSGVKALSPEGMPLGILPDTVFADEVVELPRNSRVLLYTDGLTEAANEKGERFGQERLTVWLEQTGARLNSAGELKQALFELLGQFQTKMALNDDQTFLIMTG
jgi:serine phosphatase RsbU (regulator of sigma subunit)